MVSSSDLAIGGLVLVLLGVTATSIFRVRGPTDLPQDSMEDPTDPQISGLQKILGQAQSILKNTFKAPIIPKGLGGGPCRGPNCLGIFQARGTRSTFDPFTGQRIALAGSTQFQNITGSNFAINQARVTQGNIIKSDLMEFIANIQNQLKIKQANTV